MIKYFLTLTIVSLILSGCNNGSTESTSTATATKSTHALNFTSQQRRIADQYISLFENGTTQIRYDYAQNIGDGRGITAGRAGFTSATGDMLIVIELYTQQNPDNTLSGYIDELTRLKQIYIANGYILTEESAFTGNLDGLEELWAENASAQAFRDVQDQIVNALYFTPALTKANELGLKMPLSLLSLYDANIQHGEGGLNTLLTEATIMTNNLTPLDGADELTWLKNFNTNRKNVLNTNSINRAIKLIELINVNNTQLTPFELSLSNNVYNLPT